eukprot:7387786-Prymnesium_polylepis.1
MAARRGLARAHLWAGACGPRHPALGLDHYSARAVAARRLSHSGAAYLGLANSELSQQAARR